MHEDVAVLYGVDESKITIERADVGISWAIVVFLCSSYSVVPTSWRVFAAMATQNG